MTVMRHDQRRISQCRSCSTMNADVSKGWLLSADHDAQQSQFPMTMSSDDDGRRPVLARLRTQPDARAQLATTGQSAAYPLHLVTAPHDRAGQWSSQGTGSSEHAADVAGVSHYTARDVAMAAPSISPDMKGGEVLDLF